MLKFLNAVMTFKKNERCERAKNLELFDVVCHVCCVSWWKLNRVNRIFVYCVLTFCVLRTAPPPSRILRTKGGGVTLVLDVKKNSGFPLYTSCLHQVIHCTWCTQTILTKIAISMFFHFYFSGFAKIGFGRFEKQDRRTVLFECLSRKA